MRLKKVLFIYLLVIFSVLTLSGCKKEKEGIDVMDMNTITFIVDNVQYGKSYIITGQQGKAIDAPIVEGRRFLYWGESGVPFDFNKPIYENIILVAYFEEAANLNLTEKLDESNLFNEKFTVSVDVITQSKSSGDLIKPGSDGSCYFYLTNGFNKELKCKLTLSEDNHLSLPLQYSFRRVDESDKTRIWKNVDELKDIEIVLPANSRVLFSLDWVWQLNDSEHKELYVNETTKYVTVTFYYEDFEKAE